MYRIAPMTQDDVAEVSRVERRCFSNPWPVSAYRRELQVPDQNYYVVLRAEPAPVPVAAGAYPNGGGEANGAVRALPRRTLLPLGLARRIGTDGLGRAEAAPIVGFAGMWTLYDEAHVTTIGIDPDHRGRGLGEWLLVTMFDEAIRRGANFLTLEVRVSNEPALALYAKYGMSVQGRRRRYYSDNNEDAHIMWSRPLRDDAYRADLAELRRGLGDRLSAISYRLSASDDVRSPTAG